MEESANGRARGRTGSRLGLGGFEALVPEEIPKAGRVLLLVPTAEEKDRIAAQFVLEGLRNGDAAIVLESEVGLRDLSRRLGNMGFDADTAVAEGRLVLLDWSAAAAARNGTPAGLDAARAALATAVSGAKVFAGLRALVDLAGALPDAVAAVATDAAARLSDSLREAGALSLVLVPRTHGLPAPLGEAFDVVLDLRPLKPSGLGLAVLSIGGTELPRSHMVLSSADGRLVLEAPKRPSGMPPTASVECPVCKSTIPAGAPECPVCKSPRPVRRPGEPEVLDYIEALGQRVGLPESPLEAPPPAAPEAPPVPEGKGREAPPARPEPERRGLTNGLARRRMPPAAPTPPPGRVNGLTSTIVAARRGMTNGLTNGNGFTNGLGSARFASEGRRGAWRVYLVPIVAVALLAMPLLLAPESALVSTYGIDGSFADWPARVSLAEDASLPGGIDLTSAAVRVEGDRFFGFVGTRDPILPGSPDHLQADVLRAFVDTDGNAATGYRAEGVGAEVLVEIAGAQGRVTSASVLEFTGADGSDWSGWQAVDSPVVAIGAGADATRLEFSFLSPAGRNGGSPRVLFESSATGGAADTSGFALSPDRGMLVVSQVSIAPDAFTGGSANLLEIRLRATQGTATLASLRLTAAGTLPEASLRTATLVDAASSSTLATADRYQNGLNLVLASPLTIAASETALRVEVGVDPAATGTLSVSIEKDSDVIVQDAAVYLETLPSDRDRAYAGAVPAGTVIDGAFGEWSQAADDTLNEPTAGGNPDVDLAKYDSIREGSTVAVYAKVAGRILHGALVPARNPGVPQVAPLDSDRDGVPDTVEAPLGSTLPFDFNNDNTSDAASGNDRDGDTFQDYPPPGTDYWLNTTIPAWYPAPYAGRFVSVYIGPVQRPAARGEDTLRVYIDSDATAGTGYAGPVGADWMVEVVGRGATARTQGLFRFTGANPGQWSWARQSDVAFAIGTRQIELAASLLTAPVPGTQITIDLRDWKGDFDVSGVATRGATRSAVGISIEAGAYTASLPADLSDPVRIQSDAFTMEWRLSGLSAESDAGVTPLNLSSGGLVASESAASYELRIGATDGSLEYAFGPGSIKEQIVLAAPPTDVAGFSALRARFSLALSQGASLMTAPGSPGSRGGEGEIAVLVNGEVRARFPSPSMTDSGDRVSSCTYELPSPGTLDVVCPVDGFAETRYPIAIDPSVTYVLSNTGTYGVAGEFLGWSVATGDFNGDGYLDVLAGAPFNNKNGTNAGMGFLYFGPFGSDITSPNVALRGNQSNTGRAGYAVAAGDFDNDGYDDAVVGQQNGQPVLEFNGRATWPGFVSTANATFPVPSPIATDSFGRSFGVGDFNNDGNKDLVIGRPVYPSTSFPDGRGYLFFGPFAVYEPTADLTLAPFNNSKGNFGWAFGAGRIDSDSQDDLVVGEPIMPFAGSTFGRISLFKGSSLTGSGTKTPDKTIINLVSGARFGAAVAVGKLNTDAYADVLVGAYAYSSLNGRAYVFLAKNDGSGLDQNQTADYQFASQSSLERFGTSVLILDYFDDGGNDVVVSGPSYNTDDGRVYVFNDPTTDQATPDETLTGATGNDERLGYFLAGGKGSNDPRTLMAIGAPYWDDTGQSPTWVDAGRAIIASIPEFADAALVAGLAVVLVVFVRRRRRGPGR